MAGPFIAGTSKVWVGVMHDRPDGRVVASFESDEGSGARMELTWRQAASAALAILAAAACASDKAGVSSDDWSTYLHEQWERAGFRGSAS